ncbi:hypothetical protein [Caldinitratiruptor microaerophilus]|nr:hypothetical protein [Caldinitratiruptor microaerophilus]
MTESRDVNWEARYLDAIEARLGSLEQGQAALRAEVVALRAEVKQDIGALRAEVKQDAGALRAEVKGEIGAFRSEMRQELRALHRQIWGLAAGIVLAVISVWLKDLA